MDLPHFVDNPKYRLVLQELIDDLPCGGAIFDQNRELIACNTLFAELLGLPGDSVFDRLACLRLVVLAGRYDAADRRCPCMVVGGERRVCEKMRPDGAVLEVECRSFQGGGFIALCSDVSERKAIERTLASRCRELDKLNGELVDTNAKLEAARQALEGLVRQDALTGAWNRLKIEEYAQQEMLRKARYGHPLSLIFIDLDHFKRVNDTAGHAAGDAVLRGFCDVARHCMRSTDQLGRWGGEEFAIVLPNSGLTVASVLAERIRETLATHDFPEAGRVTASFGVAEFQLRESWDAWFSRADAALYRAKNDGRNRVVVDEMPSGDGAMAEMIEASFVRLVWRDSYDSGNALIDRQHRILFDHANGLLSSILGRRPKDEVVPQINVMVADLSTHFHDEESIMRELSFPGYDKHKRIHDLLLDTAKEMRKKFLCDRLSCGELFSFFAYDIVSQHMLMEDRKFFVHFRAEDRAGPDVCQRH